MTIDYERVRATLTEAAPFDVLSAAELEELARSCREISLEPHELLVRDGDALTCAYVLEKGILTRRLVTAEGKGVLLNYTRRAIAFALACVLDHSPHLGMAEAVVPSVVIAVPGEAIERLISQNAKFALAVVHALARSSVRQTEVLYDLTFPVSVRLARLLYRRASGMGVCELDISKSAIAEMLGTVPETLSRALAALRRDGLIETDARVIRVCDLEKLRAFAQL